MSIQIDLGILIVLWMWGEEGTCWGGEGMTKDEFDKGHFDFIPAWEIGPGRIVILWNEFVKMGCVKGMSDVPREGAVSIVGNGMNRGWEC